jgi:hypothetical protein
MESSKMRFKVALSMFLVEILPEDTPPLHRWFSKHDLTFEEAKAEAINYLEDCKEGILKKLEAIENLTEEACILSAAGQVIEYAKFVERLRKRDEDDNS